MTITLARIEDHEGAGTCGYCGREDLRWIYCLTDGSLVGSECAKKIIGHTIDPRSHARLIDFHVIGEWQNRFGVIYLLWQHDTAGSVYSETIDGKVKHHNNGDLLKLWVRDGWMAA